MRATFLSVHNNQLLEIFTTPRNQNSGEFFVWMVGDIKGQRTVLNHFVCQDDYEKQLCYVQPGDLVWKDAEQSDIPSARTESAVANEETIERGVLWDDARLQCYLAIRLFPVDRKASNAAKKFLLGDWSDGTVTLSFKPQNQLIIHFPTPASHHRSLFAAANLDHANWWNLSRWWLFLMNEQKVQGQKMGLWKCDEGELHLFSDREDVLVHVFRRV